MLEIAHVTTELLDSESILIGWVRWRSIGDRTGEEFEIKHYSDSHE